MHDVAVSAVNCVEPGRYWSKGWSDLLTEAASPIVKGRKIDAVFCCGGGPHHRQANPAAIAADRLGLRCPAMSIDAGDISGSMALLAAWQFIRGSFGKAVLVLGAAKVSDLSESSRIAILDSLLDQEVGAAANVSFAAQAGLLAAGYCHRHAVDQKTFARVSASNLEAWSRLSGLRAATAEEVSQDLIAAPPLVRADFAQLLDGAGAVLLVDGRYEDVPTSVRLDAVASSTDVVNPWDRADPFAFNAVSQAVDLVLKQKNDLPGWMEIDAACSVIQYLAQRAVARSRPPAATSGEPSRLNVYGGCQGRGRPFGVSAFYQLQDICREGRAGDTALSLAAGGMASIAVAALVSIGGVQ